MKTINKHITINATPEIVFDALTNSDEIIKYYPLKSVETEWKVNTDIIIKGEVNGQDFTDYGIIQELSKPNKFKYTYWSDNHGTEKIKENYISINYTLSENDNGTQLNLEQSNLPSDEMLNVMDGVWDFLLSNLKRHIENI